MINVKDSLFGCKLQVNEIEITYDIIYSYRRTIGLEVKQKGGKVVLRLPIGTPVDMGHNFVKEKSYWIIKTLAKIDERNAASPSRRYTTGAVHLFLGRKYVLNVIIDKKEGVELIDDTMTVSVKNPSRVEATLKKWYLHQANYYFAEIGAPWVREFWERYGQFPKKFENKFVKGYWGLCRSDGLIRFNVELVRAPKESIEYVIMHELCHMRYQNHSAEFYQLLESFMSDWKTRKKLLDTTVSCRD